MNLKWVFEEARILAAGIALVTINSVEKIEFIENLRKYGDTAFERVVLWLIPVELPPPSPTPGTAK